MRLKRLKSLGPHPEEAQSAVSKDELVEGRYSAAGSAQRS